MELGPENGTLTVRTQKGGAASKAGHNLHMEVGNWKAVLDLDAESASLTADPRSFRVIEGSGGVLPLGDDEKAAIPQTIDEEVLKGQPIEFRSTRVVRNGERADVEGELTLFGAERPVAFALQLADGQVSGSARISHRAFGVKPYSALFGTLKVADEVVIELDARSTDG
jgi:hypothetical protein